MELQLHRTLELWRQRNSSPKSAFSRLLSNGNESAADVTSSQMQNVSQQIKAILRVTAVVLPVALTAPCTPALATDLGIASIYQTAPGPVNNWTGSYMGYSGGNAWGNAVVPNDPAGPGQAHFNLGSGATSFSSGFNLQNGNLVFGYEGDT